MCVCMFLWGSVFGHGSGNIHIKTGNVYSLYSSSYAERNKYLTTWRTCNASVIHYE